MKRRACVACSGRVYSTMPSRHAPAQTRRMLVERTRPYVPKISESWLRCTLPDRFCTSTVHPRTSSCSPSLSLLLRLLLRWSRSSVSVISQQQQLQTTIKKSSHNTHHCMPTHQNATRLFDVTSAQKGRFHQSNRSICFFLVFFFIVSIPFFFFPLFFFSLYKKTNLD